MTYLTYENINSLDEISFIANSSYTIKFVVQNQSGSPISLSGATCTWVMAPYGTDYAVISKSGNVITDNSFEVVLSPSDTLGLSGAYTHQASVTFASGVKCTPAQGRIVLVKGID